MKTNIIGESAAMLELLDQVSKAASLNKPVLIIGERGTGKELIAERLHYLSERWQNDYIKMNCAAISDTLIESELFGHETGSFTGASKQHIGKFERADNGSLFLDELATMNFRVQEKLLRVLEYGEFERVGGQKTIQTDIRLIAATNVDLPTLAKQGKFRADLLDRLSFDVITLPPLRHRDSDVLLLAEHFALQFSLELNRDYFPGFSDEVKQQLLSYHWPGNIRELRNVVERSLYRHLDPDELVEQLIFDPFASPWRLSSEAPEDQQIVKNTDLSFSEQVAHLEVSLIEKALKDNLGSQTKASESLGLTYHQFRALLKKHGIKAKDMS